MGARELLDLTPCDLFSFIRGRTLWLIGDSIQQVRCQRFYAEPSEVFVGSLKVLQSFFAGPSEGPWAGLLEDMLFKLNRVF